MSLLGRYHIMLTSDEYAAITGRLKAFADLFDEHEQVYGAVSPGTTGRGDRLRKIVAELENHTTYIQEEEPMGQPTPDPRQWAYGKWWTQPDEGDPQELDPQPPPPSWANAEEN